MTEVEQMAKFVARTAFDDLSKDARQQLKIRTLDALGCAMGKGGDIQRVESCRKFRLNPSHLAEGEELKSSSN